MKFLYGKFQSRDSNTDQALKGILGSDIENLFFYPFWSKLYTSFVASLYVLLVGLVPWNVSLSGGQYFLPSYWHHLFLPLQKPSHQLSHAETVGNFFSLQISGIKGNCSGLPVEWDAKPTSYTTSCTFLPICMAQWTGQFDEHHPYICYSHKLLLAFVLLVFANFVS